MILSQMKSCRSLAGRSLMFSWTSMNSGHGGHVEAGARLVEGPHDGRIGVGLDRVVGLHAGQVFLELCEVAAELVVVDHEQRRAVLAGQLQRLETMGSAGSDEDQDVSLRFGFAT